MAESSNKIKAIGGYFELADQDNENGHPPVNGIPFNTCRNALEYILLQLPDIKRIFLPFYTCEAIVEPLKKLSVKYEFYHINGQLEIAEKLLLEKGDYLIINNYFGIKDAYIIEQSKKYYNRLIIDNAQALFAPTIQKVKAVYSTRKFVGVADGGFAIGVSAEQTLQFEVDDSSEHNSHLLIRKIQGAEAGFKEYQENESKLNNQPIRRMSYQTQNILNHIDYKAIINKRRQNYQYLCNALGNINLFQLPSIDSFTCPMIYPLRTNDDTLRKKLIDNKIFVAKYWPNVLEWCKKDDIEYELCEHVIPLPIDQRYNKKDMDRIINIINM